MPESVEDMEGRACDALRDLVAEVSAVEVGGMIREHDRADIVVVYLDVQGRPHRLVAEMKTNGQPRNVRSALLELLKYADRFGAVPMFVAPYLSPQAQALCKEHDVAFLDLVGNARLSLEGVFIERRVSDRPPADRRALRSLFRPKSAQALRVLLRDPARAWRVTDMAEAASISLGHASNVRKGLVDREWAEVSDRGLSLSAPDSLLDAWRDEYEAPRGRRYAFYTVLHGRAFEEAARDVLGVSSGAGRAVFASYSAAHWLAPYGRTGLQYFYADDAGMERLKERLKLSVSPRGENVIVIVPKDLGLFRDTVESARGAHCTSAVQTYLDLWISGERGQEAAEHLRQEKLSWST